MPESTQLEFWGVVFLIASAIGRLLNVYVALRITQLQADNSDLKKYLEDCKRDRKPTQGTRKGDATEEADDEWLEKKGIDVKGQE